MASLTKAGKALGPVSSAEPAEMWPPRCRPRPGLLTFSVGLKRGGGQKRQAREKVAAVLDGDVPGERGLVGWGSALHVADSFCFARCDFTISSRAETGGLAALLCEMLRRGMATSFPGSKRTQVQLLLDVVHSRAIIDQVFNE